jgi:hypothetical protein
MSDTKEQHDSPLARIRVGLEKLARENMDEFIDNIIPVSADKEDWIRHDEIILDEVAEFERLAESFDVIVDVAMEAFWYRLRQFNLDEHPSLRPRRGEKMCNVCSMEFFLKKYKELGDAKGKTNDFVYMIARDKHL